MMVKADWNATSIQGSAGRERLRAKVEKSLLPCLPITRPAPWHPHETVEIAWGTRLDCTLLSGILPMSRLTALLGSRLIVEIVAASVFFFAMTAMKTYPLILHSTTHISPDPGDPLLNTWIMAWDFHALTTDPWKLFNANILYPAENTLAFSEHLMGVLPIFAPAYVLTGNPIFAYNLVFFLSFLLSGISMFFLIQYWTQEFWASLISGFLFAFAPIRFGQLGHLQLLNFYWVPLVFLFLEKFLRSRQWRDMLWFAIFYWLQVLCSVYLGWFTTIAVALYVLYHAFSIDKRDLLSRSMVPRYVTFAALSLLILLPLHLPYYEAKQQWGFSRSLGDCVSFSADLFLSYLSVPPSMTDLYLSMFRFAKSSFGGWEKWLFPGFVLPLLVVLGSVPGSGFLPSDKTMRMKRIFWLILVSSFILSLGPYLVILDRNTHIPLPYLLLYHGVPGFKAMRVPARFGFMVVLAASVLAALGFLRACTYLNPGPGFRRLKSPACQAVLGLFCLGLLTLELGFKPLPLVRIQTGHEVPEVYRWLAAKQLNGPIVELPFGLWEDYRYTYFSTYHWLPIVNGSTGFSPPTYSQITSEMKALPSRKTVEFLSAIGVKGVIVHTGMLPPDEALQWRRLDLAKTSLEKVAEFGSDAIYKIPSVELTHQLDLELAVPDRLPAGAEVRLPLLTKGMGHRPWVHPRPLGRTKAIVEWEERRTGRISIQKAKLVLPLVIGAEEVLPMSLSVRTPSSLGRYMLSVHLPALDISLAPAGVELITGPFPTSLTSPKLLSAAYALEGSRLRPLASGPVTISLKIVNTGKALWLAETEDGKGSVRLGWRWLKGKQEVPDTYGREPLKHDLYPGQSYVLNVSVPPPHDPGNYTLELGLVSELVTWFVDQGVKPLRLPVDVVSSREGAFP